MALLAGLKLEGRFADWDRDDFTSDRRGAGHEDARRRSPSAPAVGAPEHRAPTPRGQTQTHQVARQTPDTAAGPNRPPTRKAVVTATSLDGIWANGARRVGMSMQSRSLSPRGRIGDIGRMSGAGARRRLNERRESAVLYRN